MIQCTTVSCKNRIIIVKSNIIPLLFRYKNIENIETDIQDIDKHFTKFRNALNLPRET